MLSFWKWLFREFYGPTVKCIECGMRGVKAEMFYDKDYGYFCTVGREHLVSTESCSLGQTES